MSKEPNSFVSPTGKPGGIGGTMVKNLWSKPNCIGTLLRTIVPIVLDSKNESSGTSARIIVASKSESHVNGDLPFAWGMRYWTQISNSQI